MTGGNGSSVALAGGPVGATAFSGVFLPTLVVALVGLSAVYGVVRKPLAFSVSGSS